VSTSSRFRSCADRAANPTSCRLPVCSRIGSLHIFGHYFGHPFVGRHTSRARAMKMNFRGNNVQGRFIGAPVVRQHMKWLPGDRLASISLFDCRPCELLCACHREHGTCGLPHSKCRLRQRCDIADRLRGLWIALSNLCNEPGHYRAEKCQTGSETRGAARGIAARALRWRAPGPQLSDATRTGV
jgi:hypothetical protein